MNLRYIDVAFEWKIHNICKGKSTKIYFRLSLKTVFCLTGIIISIFDIMSYYIHKMCVLTILLLESWAFKQVRITNLPRLEYKLTAVLQMFVLHCLLINLPHCCPYSKGCFTKKPHSLLLNMRTCIDDTTFDLKYAFFFIEQLNST